MLPRIVGWLAAAFAVWYLLSNPDGAAGIVLGMLHGLQHLAHSLSQFVDKF